MSKLPESMRAIEIRQPGGPEVLTPTQRPMPIPKADEILVRVAAAGVNRPDVFQRTGNYPVPPGASDLPGLEISGEVVACGAGAKLWKPGDQVCALTNGGGYAEYCTVPETQALPVPKGLTMIEAASLPETFFTVWSNVFDRGRLQAGETLLIVGAGAASTVRSSDGSARASTSARPLISARRELRAKRVRCDISRTMVLPPPPSPHRGRPQIAPRKPRGG